MPEVSDKGGKYLQGGVTSTEYLAFTSMCIPATSLGHIFDCWECNPWNLVDAIS